MIESEYKDSLTFLNCVRSDIGSYYKVIRYYPAVKNLLKEVVYS